MPDSNLTPEQFAQLMKLTPQDAVDWLMARNLMRETFAWEDVFQAEHNTQFTISRLARVDLLQDIYDGIVANVNGNLSRRDWMRDVEQLLRERGWWGVNEVTDPVTGDVVRTRFDAARLKLIFDTNTSQAYAAGLWERAQRTKKTHPYMRYVTMDDDHVRPKHRAWHNVTLPIDHPWWDQHFPPCGWRCRCRAEPMNQEDYDLGYTESRPGAEFDANAPIVQTPLVKIAPPSPMVDYVNTRTGQIVQVADGIDPGFGYNPGKARSQALKDLEQAKLQRAAKGIADAAKKDGMSE